GGATFNVPVTSSNVAAGIFVTSPLVFTGNTNFINAVFDPVAAGTTRLAITQPAGFTATTTVNANARVQFDMNVVGSSVFFQGAASATTLVGRDLQQGVTVRLQSAPPSPVDITLTVPAGSGVLLALDPLAAGAETLVLPAVNNTTNRTVYVQSTSLGSTIVRASASGYSDGTLTVNQTPSGFAFFGTSDPETVPGTPATYRVYSIQLNNFGAFQSWQETRGGATFNVPVTSSNAAAGIFVTSPLVFTGNTNFVNATFLPVSAGSTLLAITQPGGFTPTTTTNTNARAQFTANVTSGLAVVTLTVPDNTATEAGQTTGSFTLTRSGGNTASALAVRLALSGTATLSTDFSWSPGGSFTGGGIYQFSIPAGQESLTVTVTPAQDNLVEGAETVVVTLSPSAVDPPVYSIGAPNAGTINIADDPPVVTLAVTDNTATEAGQTTGAFVVSRSGGNLATALQVRVATSGSAAVSTDFNWSPGGAFLGSGLYQFSIPASQASLTVTVTPVLDNLVEGPETLVLDLSPSIGTPPTYNIGAQNGGTITIVDDPPVVTLTVTDGTASESPPDTGTFVLARSGGNLGTALPVRVAVAGTATISTDFNLSPGGAFVGGGIYQWSIPAAAAAQSVTLTPVNDTVPEVDETAIFTLSASGTTPPNYTIGTPDTGTITIISDEKPLAGTGVVASPAVDPSPSSASATLAAAPATAAPANSTLSKAELKRQQRVEKARQRAAQQEAKRALKQARGPGAKTQAGAPVSSPASGVATVPVQPAASRPPD
ncbi:MAG: Calx-beta domain-containing protein, partial [Cryobacterium sp.]